MTTLTLNKLPEGFIVTSDEKPKKGDKMRFNIGSDTVICTNVDETTVYHSKGHYDKDGTIKVVVQQDQISFSEDIPEEKLREIGWFDAKPEMIPFPDSEGLRDGKEIKTWMNGWKEGHVEGFQKSQELLSDRRFTLEEVGELFQQIVRIIPEQELRKWTKESFVKHFGSLENRSWTIEVEMELDSHDLTTSEWLKPKFYNGKLKVTKIL
jgi:hypothetical protein